VVNLLYLKTLILEKFVTLVRRKIEKQVTGEISFTKDKGENRMPSVTLTDPNQAARFVVEGQDAVGGKQPVNGIASLSDPNIGYVAVGTNPGELFMVPKATSFPAPGQTLTVTVNVKFTTSPGGTVLPEVNVDVILAPPTVPVEATHVVITDGPSVVPTIDAPADPGTPTVSFTV